MAKKPITKIEVAAGFWKDLEAWRRHPDYWAIRRDIARIVQRRAAGEDGGDAPFTGGKERWGGLHHAHITSKLIVFTGYPAEGTLKLCSVVKHDAYGFRQERKSMANTFASRMQRALGARPVASPDWSGLKWRDPGDIPDHPELRELSEDGLRGLYQEILDEQDSLERLQRRMGEMSGSLGDAFADAWLEALIAAQEAVQDEHLARLKPRTTSALHVADFSSWSPAP